MISNVYCYLPWSFFDNFFFFLHDLSIDLSDKYRHLYVCHFKALHWYESTFLLSNLYSDYRIDNSILNINKKIVTTPFFIDKRSFFNFFLRNLNVNNNGHVLYRNAVLIFSFKYVCFELHGSDFMSHLLDIELSSFFKWK